MLNMQPEVILQALTQSFNIQPEMISAHVSAIINEKLKQSVKQQLEKYRFSANTKMYKKMT